MICYCCGQWADELDEFTALCETCNKAYQMGKEDAGCNREHVSDEDEEW